MLYTTLGRVAAGVVLAYAILNLALYFGVAYGTIVGPDVERALGGLTMRESLVKSFWSLMLAISLGVLTDISRSIARRNQMTAGSS